MRILILGAGVVGSLNTATSAAEPAYHSSPSAGPQIRTRSCPGGSWPGGFIASVQVAFVPHRVRREFISFSWAIHSLDDLRGWW